MLLHVCMCLLIALGWSAAVMSQDPTASGTGQLQRQQNANSATKDTSGTSGDQVTQPAGAKATTIIGCLSAADADGRLHLTSMQYRTGIEVVGPGDLVDAAGKKVKLTGTWAPAGATEAGAKTSKKFQASSADVVADTCSSPSQTNPVSKQKQKKKQQ